MLNFIGTGSAFNTALGNTSAYMRSGDRLLLVDCGGSVFERLQASGILKDLSCLDVCVTHTHGDHVGSLGDLVLYCHFILKIRPTLRHPEAARIGALMELFGVPENAYVLDGAPFFELAEWLSCSFISSEHADTMPSYGLWIRTREDSFWYSGDSKRIPDAVLSAFLEGDIARMYQDTSGMEYPEALHMSLNALRQIVPEAHRGRVSCMHLDETFPSQEAEALGFRVVSRETGK